jgi:type III pantothenate kinase
VILLLDIGNTNSHLGLSRAGRIIRHINVPTASWGSKSSSVLLKRFIGSNPIEGAAICSVVPKATPLATALLWKRYGIKPLDLNCKTVKGVGIRYPRPGTIGPDRLANAVAANQLIGAPVVVVDFGTAVTFDVVDAKGSYVGGIIAPGLAAMTDYLHERTALLPRIKIRQAKSVIGKSTEQAMLAGAVHGYRGLIRELIKQLRGELKTRSLKVIATGGYAELMAAGLPEITAVDPLLTLRGLQAVWEQTPNQGRG